MDPGSNHVTLYSKQEADVFDLINAFHPKETTTQIPI
jgi:hypothetical protein